MTRTLLLILLLATLTACGPAQLESTEPPQQPLPTASADWTSIKFTQSGGIMGLLRTLEISRDGAWTFTNERADQTITGKLSAAELDELSDLIDSLSIKSDKQSGVCADCFIYSIEIFSSGKPLTVEADDVNLGESVLGPLVDFMANLMSEALTK